VTPGRWRLADAGYRSEATLAQLSDSATEVIVALGREGKGRVAIDADPAGRTTAAMAAKLQTAGGPSEVPPPQVIVEPPNGWLKQVLGFRQFSLRGMRQRCAASFSWCVRH